MFRAWSKLNLLKASGIKTLNNVLSASFLNANAFETFMTFGCLIESENSNDSHIRILFGAPNVCLNVSLALALKKLAVSPQVIIFIIT